MRSSIRDWLAPVKYRSQYFVMDEIRLYANEISFLNGGQFILLLFCCGRRNSWFYRRYYLETVSSLRGIPNAMKLFTRTKASRDFTDGARDLRAKLNFSFNRTAPHILLFLQFFFSRKPAAAGCANIISWKLSRIVRSPSFPSYLFNEPGLFMGTFAASEAAERQ